MGKFPCGLFLLGKCPNVGDPSGCRKGPHNQDLAPFCKSWARGQCTGCYMRHYYLAADNKLLAIKAEPEEALDARVEQLEDNEVSLRFVVDFETGKRSFRSEQENTATLVSIENIHVYEYKEEDRTGSESRGKLKLSSDSRASPCRDNKVSEDSRPRGKTSYDNICKSRKEYLIRGKEEGEKRSKYIEDTRKSSDTMTDREDRSKKDIRINHKKEENGEKSDLRKHRKVGSPSVKLIMDKKEKGKISSSSPMLPPPPSSRLNTNANLEELGRRRKYLRPCAVPEISEEADDYNPTSILKLFLAKEEERKRYDRIARSEELIWEHSDTGCREIDGQRRNTATRRRKEDSKVCDSMKEDRQIAKTLKRKISEDRRDCSRDRKFPKTGENRDWNIREDQIRDRKTNKNRSRYRSISKDRCKGNNSRNQDRKISKNPSWDRKISQNGYMEKKISEDKISDEKISKDQRQGRKSRKYSGDRKSSKDRTGWSKQPPPSRGMDLSKANANMEDLGPRRTCLKSNDELDNSGGADGYNPASLLKSALAINGKRR